MKAKDFLLMGLLFSGAFLQAQTNTGCKCCEAAFRQFDFWVGDWVTTVAGKPAGTNHIVILQDSCVIQENWVSAAANYTGTSYNFYDPVSGKWRQTWIDNQGGNLLLEGGMENGNMVMYSGELKNQEGKPYINRITWTPSPDGSVRQLWEVSNDNGKNWNAVFDGLYKQKE